MGVLERIRKNMTGMETVCISYSQMASMVRTKFIEGADDDYLKKVKRTAKSRTFDRYSIDQLDSKDGNCQLTVYPILSSFFILLLGKHVSLTNQEEKTVYTIKNRQWKKFYKAVELAIEMEKLNRNN